MASSSLSRAVLGALGGLAVAGLAVLFGALRVGVAVLSGETVSTAGATSGMALFATSFAVGGGVTGLLWPANESAWRTYLAFISGMGVVMAGIISLDDGSPTTWLPGTWIMWGALSALFGGALARGYQRG